MSPRNDAFLNNSFLVEIDGIGPVSFQSVEGIEASVKIVDERDGNEGIHRRKVPGLISFSNIILRRGLTKSSGLIDWFKTVMDGKTERRSGSITILDESAQPLVRFEFRNAWPCRLKYSNLNALANDVAIEEVEIVIEDLAVAFV